MSILSYSSLYTSPNHQPLSAHLVALVVPLLPDLAALGLPGIHHPLALEPAAGVVPLVLFVWGWKGQNRLKQNPIKLLFPPLQFNSVVTFYCHLFITAITYRAANGGFTNTPPWQNSKIFSQYLNPKKLKKPPISPKNTKIPP